MSTALRERPAPAGTGNGGVPARRAVIRWAWRLFRREWRQQLLVLALIVVAVAATLLGAAVATDTPPPAGAGFGTAQDMVTLGGGPRLASQLAELRQHVGRVDVIENQTVAIPGSINTYDLRAQDPHGAFGQPMLSLVSGHYPTGAGQVAVTSEVASAFNLKIGNVWHQGGGMARRVVGIVQNPQSLLDEFALVAPGQVAAPSQVIVLFTAPAATTAKLGSLSQDVVTRHAVVASNPINP
jgi:putative ABC transport system permease protein